VSGGSPLTAGLVRTHRIMPRAAGYVFTRMFINTRGLGSFPDDLCPLGARRVELSGVPRVTAAYVWGRDEPAVLALHGWGTDSTTMVAVMDAAVKYGESAMCFDAPGHGASPGSHATIAEYAHATHAVLRRFPSVHTVVAHSLASIAAVGAVGQRQTTNVSNMLLLAPACSLSGVLERWASERGLPHGVVNLICRGLLRRDGVPVSHWDCRTLGVPAEVQVRILHDPADDSVPISDSHQIAAEIPVDVRETAGAGHQGIVGSDAMRAALAAFLRSEKTA
jgi:Serine aminopeptidase, S33